MSDSDGRDARKLEILVKGATISTLIMRIAWALIIISVLAGLITTGIGRLGSNGHKAQTTGIYSSVITAAVLASGVVWYYVVSRIEARRRNKLIRRRRPACVVVAAELAGTFVSNTAAPLAPRALSLVLGEGVIELWSGPTRAARVALEITEELSEVSAAGRRGLVDFQLGPRGSLTLRLVSEEFFTARVLDQAQTLGIVEAVQAQIDERRTT